MNSSKEKPGASSGKNFIQAGATVDGRYGPFETVFPDKPGEKSGQRRQRTTLRGVVLRPHQSTGNWLVHWFTIGKTSFVPYSKLKIVASSTPSAVEQIQILLKNNKDLYIGGPDELRHYCDTCLSVNNKKRFAATTPAPTVSPSPAKQTRPNCPRPSSLPTRVNATQGEF